MEFNLDVQVIEVCAFDRRGKWEQFARDRDRFERRINNLKEMLNDVLANDHRQKIYNQRFQKENEHT